MEEGRDKPGSNGQQVSAPVVSLQSALRRARLENAERSDGLTALRSTEWARLDLLRETIAPIVDEARKHSDMFDLALTQGEHPRLFVDMIGFVEMARDRRAYRFLQDTRNGRVLIAEGEDPVAMSQAIADYAARRLIEREKALAADALSSSGQETPLAAKPAATAEPPVARSVEALGPGASRVPPLTRPRAARIFARAFLFLVETLGSIVFFGSLALGVWWLVAHYAR